MTTASRPTFDTAKGGQKDLSALSKQYSSRDLPSHNKLKYREPGQGASEDIRGRDFRRDLEDRERIAIREKEKGGSRTDRDRIRAIEASAAQAKRPRQEAIQGNLDADDAADNDSDSSDSDEDDTAELMAELARIKAERAAEASKKESQQKQREEQIRIENIIQGNPLLQYSGGAAEAPKADLRVKRRWDDDVVFKNCSRSEPDKKERGFINDSLRSDFHRKFMEKYIK